MTPEFLAAVKAWKFEGMSLATREHVTCEGVFTSQSFLINGLVFNIHDEVGHIVLEKFLRDWFTAKGFSWQLCNDRLMVWPGNEPDDAWVGDSNGLNDHISAALHVLACEEGAK